MHLEIRIELYGDLALLGLWNLQFMVSLFK